MRDPANDPNNIGYCGILIVPEMEYQGFFIPRGVEQAARDMLQRAKTLATFTPDLSLSRPVNAAAEASSDEGRLLGTLCAAAVDVARKGMTDHVATVLAAIRLLSGKDYFWIEAKVEPAGTTTSLEALNASNVIEAREAFGRLPGVMTADMVQMLKKAKKE